MEDREDVLRYCSQESRLKVLREIQQKGKITVKQIESVSYSYASDIITNLYRMGLLVRKTSGRFGDTAYRYSLNHKGIEILEHINKQGTQPEAGQTTLPVIEPVTGIMSIDGEPFLGREEELKILKEFLIQKRNVLVEAPRGMGKTSLLRAFQHLHQKKFRIFYIKKSKDIKPALLDILSEAGAPKPKNATILELQGTVKALLQDLGKNKPVIVFLDHLEDGHLKTEELLIFLEESQICFAGAASELKERLGRYFRERMKLEPLKEEDASRLVRFEFRQKLGMDAPESFITLVLRKSGRVPFFIKDILREVETQNQLQAFDFKDYPDRASQVVERMAPHPMLGETEEKIDILPVWTLFIIAYLFLAFRYIAMGARDYELFIVAGALGYLLRVVGMSMNKRR